jgi:Pyruvate/2-oxoacid:ferredoxin oxidoreductase gamma subunit
VRLHCEIYEPDLTFLDHTVLRGDELLGLVEKQKLPKEDGILVSNYPAGPEEFLGYLNRRLEEVFEHAGAGLDYRFTGNVYSVDAKEIADKLKIDFQNTAILGCIVRALEEEDVITLPIGIVKSVVEEGIKGKPGKIIKPNLEAIDMGYERVSCYRTYVPEGAGI